MPLRASFFIRRVELPPQLVDKRSDMMSASMHVLCTSEVHGRTVREMAVDGRHAHHYTSSGGAQNFSSRVDQDAIRTIKLSSFSLLYRRMKDDDYERTEFRLNDDCDDTEYEITITLLGKLRRDRHDGT